MAYPSDATNSVASAALATAGFVPDLWIDEILAAHKANLVLATLVRKVNVKGKRGDSITLPKPDRGTATAKGTGASGAVALQVAAGTGITIALTSHWEYSRLIEDIAEVHSLPSMRRFYTDDAGYALAKAKDTALFAAARTLKGGSGTAAWTKAVLAGDGSTDYVDASGNANSTAITDAGIRRMIQTLDDNDIPMSDRYLVVPPVARRIMMGLARFSEQAFVGSGDTIRNGKLGQVYGVAVHVSTNCPTPTTGTTVRVGLFAHRDAIILADVQTARVQTQYKQEFLSTLLTADTIFGCGEAYDTAGMGVAMPSA
jgi:hypothetical protein